MFEYLRSLLFKNCTKFLTKLFVTFIHLVVIFHANSTQLLYHGIATMDDKLSALNSETSHNER